MMGLLTVQEFIPHNICSPQQIFPKELPFLKTWSIYTENKIIGHYKSSLDMVNDIYIWKNYVELDFPFQEKEIPLTIESEADFNKKEVLQEFIIEFQIDEFNADIQGKIVNDILLVNSTIAGKKHKLILPWKQGTNVMSNGLLPWITSTDLRPGERLSWELFNPLTNQKEKVTAFVERNTVLFLNNRFVNAFIVKMNYHDITIDFWIDEAGFPVKVHTPWGWNLVAESK